MSEFFVENKRKLCEDVANLIAFIENNPLIRQVLFTHKSIGALWSFEDKRLSASYSEPASHSKT